MTTELSTYQDNPPAMSGGDEVASLVRLAIEQKVPVEVLERLVALQERVTERNARTSFFEALAAFRDECPPIVKTFENTQFAVTRNGVSRKARYAPLEEIDRVARPVATKHGLVWTWDTRVEGELMHVTCRVIHTMGHSETATVSISRESKAGSSPQQKDGSTQTYGMRYSLVAALGITTADEDRDGAGGRLEDQNQITDVQLANLVDLIDEAGIKRERVCSWLRVAELGDMNMSQYNVVAAEAKKRIEGRTG